MSPLAWAVFVAFVAYVVWDGVRRGKASKDLEGYYAGGRSVPWWAAGLSIMATQASAITIIGTTGQGHEDGMQFLQTYFGLPLAMVLLCLFMVPLYRKNPILTAYEYLEGRFGPATRSLASLIFLLSRCLALGAVIYAPAVMFAEMTGLEVTWTALIIGALTTTYTFFGGIHAVVWTDVKQMLVIFGGLLLCLGVVLWRVLEQVDFGAALEVIGAAGRLNAVEPTPESTSFLPRSLDDFQAGTGTPSFWEEKYNLWSGLFGGLFLMLAYFGCDQSQMQRMLTTPTANDARRTLLLSAFAKIPMQVLVLFLGALLFLFHTLGQEELLYRTSDQQKAEAPEHREAMDALEARFEQVTEERRALVLEMSALPEGPQSDRERVARFQELVLESAALRKSARTEVSAEDPAARKDVTDTNFVFPHFILNNLHPLILGLIVAAIFAAAMSSVDSVLNSLSAATIVDFFRRYLAPHASEASVLRAGRLATLFWGAVATVTAVAFQGKGSVIELVNKVGSYFYGSLLGVFVLAIFVPRAGHAASFFGLVGGMATVLIVDGTLKVEFLWYNVIGCVGVLAVGLLVSLVLPAQRRD